MFHHYRNDPTAVYAGLGILAEGFIEAGGNDKPVTTVLNYAFEQE